MLKVIFGKSKIQKNCFPNRLTIKKSDVINKKIIAKKFNKSFVDIVPTVPTKASKSQKYILPDTFLL